jgi:hypothetical protein
MPASYPGLPLLVFGEICELFGPAYTLSKTYPAHCVFSPGSCRVNLTPMVFRVSYCLIAREDCPRNCLPETRFCVSDSGQTVLNPDQTLENPEPKLAPLPSLWAVSSEIELLQRSSSCFRGQVSDLLRG